MKRLLCGAALLIAFPACAQVSSRDATPSSLAATVVTATDGTSKPLSVPLVDTVARNLAADRGAIVGTTAVTLMAANTARRGFSVQVQAASGSCYISGQATATADYHSLQIAAGSYYETPTSHTTTAAISIICSSASTSVYSREW